MEDKHKMEIVGTILFGAGTMGFLIGGAGLDGPTFAASAIFTVASGLVAAVGYKLKQIDHGRGKKNKAAEKAIQRAKETTFGVWIKSCRIDVPF